MAGHQSVPRYCIPAALVDRGTACHKASSSDLCSRSCRRWVILFTHQGHVAHPANMSSSLRSWMLMPHAHNRRPRLPTLAPRPRCAAGPSETQYCTVQSAAPSVTTQCTPCTITHAGRYVAVCAGQLCTPLGTPSVLSGNCSNPLLQLHRHCQLHSQIVLGHFLASCASAACRGHHGFKPSIQPGEPALRHS